MKPNPLTTSPVSHAEATRRFLERLNDQLEAKQRLANGQQVVRDRLITLAAADELARWFKK